MCVDCVLASLRIVQIDPGDEPASFGVSVTPVPYVVIRGMSFILFVHSKQYYFPLLNNELIWLSLL
jgi:hypothetical protein